MDVKHGIAQVMAALMMGVATDATARPWVELPPIVAHGGASGYMPEDTMGSFALAISMGADFIQPTLFVTRDGVVVATHDPVLNGTTDVAEVAATVPAVRAKGRSGTYLVEELDFEQLRLLRLRPGGGHHGYAVPGNGYIDGRENFGIASLEEVLRYVHLQFKLTGRLVGIYLEVGTPAGGDESYPARAAEAIVGALANPRYAGLFDGPHGNVFLKVRDPAMARLFRRYARVPLVVDLGCREITAIGAIEFDAIAVARENLLADPECVARAHQAGLLVHAESLAGDPVGHALLLSRGVDALIATHPDVGKTVRDAYYPLLAGGQQPVSGWHLVSAGQAAAIEFDVSNPFGGARSAMSMATLLEFRVVRLPRCAPGADEEMLAHESLQVRLLKPGPARWRIELRLPQAGSACFRGTAMLRDGTRIEAHFLTG